MDKCAVVVAYYRGLDLYYNFIFARRKTSPEENFAGGKFRELPFAVDIIFAGGKFRAKSKFANIAKISTTRKIGVIQYVNTIKAQLRTFPISTFCINCILHTEGYLGVF